MAILGLDISTSCTGLCIIDDMGNVELLDKIEFNGCKTFWDKVDRADARLIEVLCRHRVDRVAIEEPLMGFRAGMSSAVTITQLMRFNGIVSNLARNRTGQVPEYYGSAHARKVCGVRLQRTAVAGKPHKEQVFDHMAANDLKHVKWPTKKDGVTPADWSRDATDAYVIARAAFLEPPAPVPVKARKSRQRRTG